MLDVADHRPLHGNDTGKVLNKRALLKNIARPDPEYADKDRDDSDADKHERLSAAKKDERSGRGDCEKRGEEGRYVGGKTNEAAGEGGDRGDRNEKRGHAGPTMSSTRMRGRLFSVSRSTDPITVHGVPGLRSAVSPAKKAMP